MVINKGRIYLQGQSAEPGVVFLGPRDSAYLVVETKLYIEFLGNTNHDKLIVVLKDLETGSLIERVLNAMEMYPVRGTLDKQS